MSNGHSGDKRDPIWRRDFPYTAEGEEEVTRREFARYTVLASVAFAAGGGLVSVWASLRRANVGEPQPIVDLAEIDVGGSHRFNYPTAADPAILIRPDADLILAFGQKCTHLGCVVFWVPAEDQFHCPCHQGVFDLAGEPVAGPPTRALTKIEVEVREGTVWALGALEID
jgi:Rieske Fe-S protein